MLLVHPVRELGRFFAALLGLLFAGSSSGHGQWWSLAGLAIVLTLSILRWFTTRYRITPERVQLRTGLLRRRTISTPADRVRTVDVTAHPLHRLLGLAAVAIGTGTSDRKKEALVLDGLSAATAGELRARLLHRAAAPASSAPQPPSELVPPFAAAPVGASSAITTPAATAVGAPDQLLAELDPSWVRYAPFTLSGALTALAVAGFGWRIIDQTQFDTSRFELGRSAARHLRSTPVWLDVVQAVLALLLLISVLSVVGYLLAFWNFRLTRHQGGSLHTSRGLITSRATSLEERRLHGVELSQPLLLRLVGGARLMAVATGLRVGRGAERGGSLLLPPCPVGQAYRTAAAVLGNAEVPGNGEVRWPELHRHGSAARRRRLSRAVLPWLLVTVALIAGWLLGWLPGWLPLGSLLALVAAVALGVDRYRNLAHGRTSAYLMISNGSLVRRRVLLTSEGIIGWNLRQSLLQRRAGVLNLTATTAAGKQAYQVTDLDPGAAIALADSTVPGLLTEFLLPR